MSVAGELCDYLQAHRGARFDWSRLNCLIFAAGWVKAATGRDAMAGIAADSAAAWIRLSRERGGMRQAVTDALRVVEKPAAYARIGDVVMLPPETHAESTGGILGICCGRTVACLSEHGGLVHIERERALCTWSLGEVAPA